MSLGASTISAEAEELIRKVLVQEHLAKGRIHIPVATTAPRQSDRSESAPEPVSMPAAEEDVALSPKIHFTGVRIQLQESDSGVTRSVEVTKIEPKAEPEPPTADPTALKEARSWIGKATVLYQGARKDFETLRPTYSNIISAHNQLVQAQQFTDQAHKAWETIGDMATRQMLDGLYADILDLDKKLFELSTRGLRPLRTPAARGLRPLRTPST